MRSELGPAERCWGCGTRRDGVQVWQLQTTKGVRLRGRFPEGGVRCRSPEPRQNFRAEEQVGRGV